MKYIGMNSYYVRICKEYKSGDDLMEAIVLNKTIVYYLLSQAIIEDDSSYRTTELREGKSAADRLLTETLLVFRRQVKHGKIELRVQPGMVLVNKDNLGLFEYLANLYSLILVTGPSNPSFAACQEFEQKLVNGQGFRKVYELKEAVMSALHTFGCREQDDKEEIFDESLLVFWKKLTQGELGVYFTANILKPEYCRVYNRRFYQNSKLSTYLCGIAKNLFLNKTRTSEFQVARNKSSELTELDDINTVSSESDSPSLFLFLYYRNRVEERKLRTVISLLQYDCNLEDKEVRQLIGINNTRIHSSRLRSHFSEWYYKNLEMVPELLDEAADYLLQREAKKQKLNEKIRAVELYRRKSIVQPGLDIFKEEFRTLPEFVEYSHIFKYVFYFAGVGKPSALAGLPDEKMMRALMELYKASLFGLQELQAVILLLYYGSDEPCGIIIDLLRSLKQELLQQEPDAEPAGRLATQLQLNIPAEVTVLENKIYESNKGLFARLAGDKDFTEIMHENEQAQGVI